MIAGLPYDAEVEYLESTGTQWIDTEINISDNNFVLECDMRSTSAGQSAWAGYFYSYVSERAMCTRLINYNADNNRLYAGYRRAAGNQIPIEGYGDYTLRKTYRLQYQNLEIIYNGTISSIKLPGNYGSEDTSTVRLFGAKMACYGFKISHNGVLVRDFIPVRVGSGASAVGCMYDRVSRRLFRNAGTGSFTIGPDVATPVMGLHFMPRPKYTAKSYIRDGLVAMWDGIENAGWGVHDPNATTWKDLSGNGFDCDVTALTGTGSLVFEEKSVLKTGYITTQPYDTDYSKEHWTIEAAINFLTRDNNNLHSGVGVYPVTIAINYSQIIYGQYTSSTNHLRRAFFGIRPASEGNNSLGTLAHVQSGYSSDTSNNATYRNGEPIASSVGGWSGGGFGNMKIAAVISGNSPNANQRIYCIRIYNRALSASEIAANYAVDKERFNLP